MYVPITEAYPGYSKNYARVVICEQTIFLFLFLNWEKIESIMKWTSVRSNIGLQTCDTMLTHRSN